MDNRFSFGEHEPEMAPDLEWLLSSTDAPLPVVAESLVEFAYGTLYRLALALLNDHREAQKVVPEMVSAALENRHRYTGAESLNLWLFSAAIPRLLRSQPQWLGKTEPPVAPEHQAEVVLWSCIDRLSPTTRLVLFLTQVLGWSEQEAGIAVGLEAGAAEVALRTARGRCFAASAREGSQVDASFRSPERLIQSLHRRWPPPAPLAPHEQAAIAVQAARLAEGRVQRTNKASRVKEASLVLLAVALVGGLLWGTSQLPPEPIEEANVFLTHTTRPTGTREPTPTPTRPYYSEPFPQGVFYTLLPGDTWEQAASRLGTTARELQRLNRIPPGAPPTIGQRLLIPGRLTPQVVPAGGGFEFSQPIPPAPGFRPTPAPPLSSEASLEDVLQRIEQTLFGDQLWWDIRVRAFAPPGILAPPAAYQMQMWRSQQTGGMGGMAGREGEQPSLAFIDIFQVNALPGSREPWFRRVPEGDFYEPLALAARILRQVFLVGWYFPFDSQQMQNQGYDSAYGTTALLFTESSDRAQNETRIWIDVHTGWPIRQQQFIREQLVLDVEFAGIEKDFSFPYEVFDPWLPWRGGFAANADGDPIPYGENPVPPIPSPQPTLAPVMPPAGFDPAGSSLTIQYLEAPDWTVSSRENWLPAQVIAGPYLVAETLLPDPQLLVCQRSTNGETLVIGQVDFLNLEEGMVSGLRWFDLTRHNQMLALDPDLHVGEIAVSPDARYLAVTQSNVLVDRVTLFDLRSGVVHHDERIDGPANLAWSPDGRYLAISSTVRANAQQGPVNLLVYEVETWEQAFSSQMAQSPGEEVSIPPDAPVLSWGIEYPPLPFYQRLCIP
jgi:DNA-directed RNA polymerase specialized sigma24 family protein